MELMEVCLELLRHAHNLHDVRVFEQNLALFVLNAFKIS